MPPILLYVVCSCLGFPRHAVGVDETGVDRPGLCMDRAIPIFAFHRVGPREGCRFTLPLDIFEQYLSVIEEQGYLTLTCTDLVSIAAGRASLPSRACLLTFDDGTADIWVYAAPLLRRHRMRGTVFVILERLRNTQSPRPTLADAWSRRCTLDELYQLPALRSINACSLDPAYNPSTDHLTFDEARALAREGICDVQSHSFDHMVHYTSGRVRGFLGPLSHWMAYAAAEEDPRLGTPIYEINSTLVGPRYCDPKALRDHLAELVARSGGSAFFERTGSMEILQREFNTASARFGLGHLESQEMWGRRTLDALQTCRRVLSDQLGTVVECLAWPFGRTSVPSQEIARNAGFVLAFAATGGGYIPGMPSGRVGRVSLKEHDVTKFRLALHHYSKAENVRREMAHAVYDSPLEIAV